MDKRKPDMWKLMQKYLTTENAHIKALEEEREILKEFSLSLHTDLQIIETKLNLLEVETATQNEMLSIKAMVHSLVAQLERFEQMYKA